MRAGIFALSFVAIASLVPALAGANPGASAFTADQIGGECPTPMLRNYGPATHLWSTYCYFAISMEGLPQQPSTALVTVQFESTGPDFGACPRIEFIHGLYGATPVAAVECHRRGVLQTVTTQLPYAHGDAIVGHYIDGPCSCGGLELYSVSVVVL